MEIPQALKTLIRHLRTDEQWRLTQLQARVASSPVDSPRLHGAVHAHTPPGEQKAHNEPTQARMKQQEQKSSSPVDAVASSPVPHQDTSATSEPSSPPPPAQAFRGGAPAITVPSTAHSAGASPRVSTQAEGTGAVERSPSARPVIRSEAPLSSQASLLGGGLSLPSSPLNSSPQHPRAGPAHGKHAQSGPAHDHEVQRSSRSAIESKAPTPPLWEEARRESPPRPASRGAPASTSRQHRHPARSWKQGSQSARGSKPGDTLATPPPLVKLPPRHPLPLRRGALKQLAKWMQLGTVTLPHVVSAPGMQLFVEHILAPSLAACGAEGGVSKGGAPSFGGTGPSPDSREAALAQKRTLRLCLKLLTQVAPAQPVLGGSWDVVVQHAFACTGGDHTTFLRFVMQVVHAWGQLRAYSRAAVKVFRPPPGHGNVAVACATMAQCVGGAAALLLTGGVMPHDCLPRAAVQAVRAAHEAAAESDDVSLPQSSKGGGGLPAEAAEAFWAQRASHSRTPAPITLADIRGGGGVGEHAPPPVRSRSSMGGGSSPRAASRSDPARSSRRRASDGSTRPSTAGGGRRGKRHVRRERNTATPAVLGSLCDLLQCMPTTLWTAFVSGCVQHMSDAHEGPGGGADWDVLASALLPAVACNQLQQPALIRWMLTDVGVPLVSSDAPATPAPWLVSALGTGDEPPLPPPDSPAHDGPMHLVQLQPAAFHHTSHLRELMQHLMFRVPDEDAAAFLGQALPGAGEGVCLATGVLAHAVSQGTDMAATLEDDEAWGRAVHDVCDVVETALDRGSLRLGGAASTDPPPPSNSLETGVQFVAADSFMGDAFMEMRGASATLKAARCSLQAAVAAVEHSKQVKGGGGAAGDAVPSTTVRPPSSTAPLVRRGGRPHSSARTVRGGSTRTGAAAAAKGARDVAAAAVQSAGQQTAACVAALESALSESQAGAAACGSWHLDPFWVMSMRLLEQVRGGLQAAEGVQAAQCVLAAADRTIVRLLPVVDTLVAHAVMPTQACLGLWLALGDGVPVITRWRHALTSWGIRRPLVLFWLAHEDAREHGTASTGALALAK